MEISEKELKERAREEKNKYYREYRRKNKDKIKKHQEDYWERKALEKLKANKERRD